MISDETVSQLRALRHTASQPLVICDVDEVVVHFLSDFDAYTRELGFKLDRGSHKWGENITQAASGRMATAMECTELVDGYFSTRTRHMCAIEGAVSSLQALAAHADIVMLTNLPHWAGEDRRANLADHGLDFPVITNSGPKGPAIKQLARQRQAAVVFIDDSPHFVQSARDHAPDVHIVHFLQDEAAAAHVPQFEFVSLRTGSWGEALPHVLQLISAV